MYNEFAFFFKDPHDVLQMCYTTFKAKKKKQKRKDVISNFYLCRISN